MARYPDDLSMRDARRLYFEANGFGDGGYKDAWVKLKAGPFPIWFPNSAQRVRSVRLHDLHHVTTDYGTDWTGEAEIGAWEIASNCRDHYAAWVLNLLALAIGLFIATGPVWRDFVRGRHSTNLYGGDFDDAMLDVGVGSFRRQLGLAGAPPSAVVADAAAFAGWSAVSLATALAVAMIVSAPVWLPLALLLR